MNGQVSRQIKIKKGEGGCFSGKMGRWMDEWIPKWDVWDGERNDWQMG